MDRSQVSESIGRYLRHVVQRNGEHLTKATRDGKGRVSINPFTGEEMLYRVPRAVTDFREELAGRGLAADSRFMNALTAAMMEVAEAPMAYLLFELQVLFQNGDGGPDPEFTLAAPGVDSVDLDAVVRGFESRRSDTGPTGA